MQRRVRTLKLAALSAAAVLGLSLMGSPPAQAGDNHGNTPSVPVPIATGLDNPRQLSFTKSGDLLVAEAGKGGAGPCLPNPEDPDAQVCFGKTGAVTKISSRGGQSRVLNGLPSIAGQGTGAQAAGTSDVAMVNGRLTVLIGLGADPAARATLGKAGKRMGTISQVRWDGKLRTVADLAAWEARHNPIDDPDSNPVGMLAEHGRYVVADAGGNTVLRVNEHGRIRLLAKFRDREVAAPPGIPNLPPTIPMQAVPTSVATKGWDGAYYVSQLTGFPFPKGAANIYRIDPRTKHKTIYASGLTNVTDLAFRGRTLYAVQISSEGLLTGPMGSVVKVNPGSSTHDPVAENLFAPYGIAIRGNSAYVTVGSVAAGAGQVIKIRL